MHGSEQSCAQPADEADNIGNLYSTVVFDTSGVEREPWSLCGSKLPRSMVITLVVVIAVALLIFYSCYRLSSGNISCEEGTVYCVVISSTCAYLLPSPVSAPNRNNE